MEITSKDQAQRNALNKTTPPVIDLIAHIEKKIADGYTGFGYSGSRVLVYPNDVPTYKALKGEARQLTREVVMNHYRAHGWTVKFEDSQRDGQWIELR